MRENHIHITNSPSVKNNSFACFVLGDKRQHVEPDLSLIPAVQSNHTGDDMFLCREQTHVIDHFCLPESACLKPLPPRSVIIYSA